MPPGPYVDIPAVLVAPTLEPTGIAVLKANGAGVPLVRTAAETGRDIRGGQTVIAETAAVPVAPVLIGAVPLLRAPVATARGVRGATARVAAPKAAAAALERARVPARRDEAATSHPTLAGRVPRGPPMTARPRPVTAVKGAATAGGVLPPMPDATARPAGANGPGRHREAPRPATGCAAQIRAAWLEPAPVGPVRGGASRRAGRAPAPSAQVPVGVRVTDHGRAEGAAARPGATEPVPPKGSLGRA